MTQRVNWYAGRTGAIEQMRAVETALADALDPRLLALVHLRVSQINGCAYCLHMHREAAHRHGETEARLLLLDAWRESGLYTDRERAALAWTEALTRITDGHAPDAVFAEARQQFHEEELISLSIAIAMINAWNRLAIGFRGDHPADRPHHASGGEHSA